MEKLTTRKDRPFFRIGIFLVVVIILAGGLMGCVATVNIPKVDNFQIKSADHSGKIDMPTHGNQLLSDLYILLKANEEAIVPICEAAITDKQCRKEGFSVFVFGGFIPGVGKRQYYTFRNVSINENKLVFTKSNSSTTFMGTPLYTRPNNCHVQVLNGGLQVDMDRYYATWLGIGHMVMAEGWAIDYIDFEKGIVGLKLELNIAGYLTIGGGSKYVLLKFPRIPESFHESYSKYTILQ